jgi:hypothetical protein
MVVDEGGNIYVIWFEGEGNGSVLFRKSSDGGASFSQPVEPFGEFECTRELGLVVSDNNVYATCLFEGERILEGDIPGMKSIDRYVAVLFARSLDGGASFESQATFHEDGSTRARQLQMIAIGDQLYLSWLSGESSSSYNSLYFRKSNDGGNTFTDPIIFESCDEVDQNDFIKASKMVASETDVYIKWECIMPTVEDEPYDIFLVNSSDSGFSFSEPLNVTNDTANSVDSNIALIDNRLYIMWSSEGPSDEEILFSNTSSSPPL